MAIVRWAPRTPARWAPYRGMSSMMNEWDGLFDEFFGLTPAGRSDWMPAVDVREEQDRYLVKVDLPGLTKQDIELSFENDVLTINGERKQEVHENGGRVHRTERYYGKFSRSLRFPGDVKQQEIDASFHDGILEIVLPKAEEARRRKIEVK